MKISTILLAVSAPWLAAHLAYALEPNEDPGAGSITNMPLQYDAQSVSTCGCMDVVFVLDITGSMGGALGNLQDSNGLPAVIDLADALSGNDLRVGLITFDGETGHDWVTVENQLTTDLSAVKATIAGLDIGFGGGAPEASDEALREMLDDTICSVNMDFNDTNGFRPQCMKHGMLITDNLPGGCDDVYSNGVDDVNADYRADEAAAAGVILSAIYVPTGQVDSTVVAIMQNYAEKTGGVYAIVNSDGSGTGQALQDALDRCGDCNSNGIIDALDILGGTSTDCDVNGTPDECELIDCNGNDVHDACDVAGGASSDCTGNGVPDE